MLVDKSHQIRRRRAAITHLVGFKEERKRMAFAFEPIFFFAHKATKHDLLAIYAITWLRLRYRERYSTVALNNISSCYLRHRGFDRAEHFSLIYCQGPRVGMGMRIATILVPKGSYRHIK